MVMELLARPFDEPPLRQHGHRDALGEDIAVLRVLLAEIQERAVPVLTIRDEVVRPHVQRYGTVKIHRLARGNQFDGPPVSEGLLRTSAHEVVYHLLDAALVDAALHLVLE